MTQVSNSQASQSQAAHTRPDWRRIDVVLLDMDGTVLDLHFDNFFWQELVPRRYAHVNGLSVEDARTRLDPKFEAAQGTLNWYCTDYWSRELSLDIAGLKHEMREGVRFLPGARTFLQTLVDAGIRTVLLTNAHPDSLALKSAQTGLHRYFEAMISSHQLGAPKEHDDFWLCLEDRLQFERSRALFVDDSLAVLLAAQRYGIGQIFAVLHPDSNQGVREASEFPAVHRVIDLLGGTLELRSG